METTFLFDPVKALCREIMKWCFWVVNIFISTSLCSLVLNAYWTERNENSLLARVDQLRLKIELLNLIIGDVKTVGRCLE